MVSLGVARPELRLSASLTNHASAITATRALRTKNTANAELTVPLALALGGRAAALLTFARTQPPRRRAARMLPPPSATTPSRWRC